MREGGEGERNRGRAGKTGDGTRGVCLDVFLDAMNLGAGRLVFGM